MFMRGLSPFHPLIPHPERTMGKEGSKGIFSSQARREIPGEDLPPLRPSAKTVCPWPGQGTYLQQELVLTEPVTFPG